MKDSWPNQALDLLIAPEFVALEDGRSSLPCGTLSFQWESLSRPHLRTIYNCVLYTQLCAASLAIADMEGIRDDEGARWRAVLA
jgi:hypothetical protein